MVTCQSRLPLPLLRCDENLCVVSETELSTCVQTEDGYLSRLVLVLVKTCVCVLSLNLN